jgi:hypothetical protein
MQCVLGLKGLKGYKVTLTYLSLHASRFPDHPVSESPGYKFGLPFSVLRRERSE